MLWSTQKVKITMLIILLAGLLGGCAAGWPASPAVKDQALRGAGFWPMEADTPKSQIVMQGSPQGQFSSYEVEGRRYYVYPDPHSNTLFVGNETAYQRYISRQQDKQLCGALDAESGAALSDCLRKLEAPR